MIVNMGPHHPSMHGVLHLIVTLDGEDVDCEPILVTMFTEAITLNGSKKLGNIQVPKKASYIRVIMLELSCIASHLLWFGPFMADIGIGVIGGEEEINWSLSSPILQASRIKWDFQKVYHYECYDEFDLEIQWQKIRFISSLFSLSQSNEGIYKNNSTGPGKNFGWSL
ncbi:hypothetical protein Godav_011592 [Gossypium davidsonii]|uniref:NADH-quinone oxidoreductase subunit D domain-containing protein n=1 Tax=Gossypium davidsonii TaxID=34287 RepID=A0A7J8RAJ8_GOSDV|nr:hypothetical protein [Gossypium davidsonii]